MTIENRFMRTSFVQYTEDSPEVVKTAAGLFKSHLRHVELQRVNAFDSNHDAGVFRIVVADPHRSPDFTEHGTSLPERYIFLQIREDGSGWLAASHKRFLYAFASYMFERMEEVRAQSFTDGKFIVPAFDWQRTSYDLFLTQEGRIQRGMDRATYIKELARLGFTHLEVNGLAYPMGLETGPKGEIYPMFYTYCPALDQFVSSRMNEGLYPEYYLSANLAYLEENAQIARKYGLVPGLTCFEPRSVPERFFDKYPMLRGARIDHPFRSFKPRYNMTITHPKVLDHYAEMLQNLMRRVPDLGFVNIWTNDSGAGFEHTKSLYVGRNGGAYMIREWKDDGEIARLAGENALRFLRTLKDAGSEINPDFRVITRLESFYGEHDTVWEGLGDGIDVETASLAARGWDMPYSHPRYPDIRTINAGSVYQVGFDEAENLHRNNLEERGGNAHFYFSVGPHQMFAPLIGVPYPGLTHKRLKMLHENDVSGLSHCGGGFPPELVPFNINHEIVREYQFNPDMNIEESLKKAASIWAGMDYRDDLLKAWKLAEEAIMAFPNVTPLYSTIGFAWYRLWARPFVPNIEALSQEQRAYYEKFMCTTPHNPNNVDLSRDVLFQLTTPEKSLLDVERIDANVWKPLDEAIGILGQAIDSEGETPCVIFDQWIRLRALKCWIMTQRSVAAWIAGVYGYMEAKDDTERNRSRDLVRDMIGKEIANSRELMDLLESGVEFMATTDQGESPLMYGGNLKELLEIRIRLMEDHSGDEPFIDHDYMMRKAGEPVV